MSPIVERIKCWLLGVKPEPQCSGEWGLAYRRVIIRHRSGLVEEHAYCCPCKAERLWLRVEEEGVEAVEIGCHAPDARIPKRRTSYSYMPSEEARYWGLR